MSRLWQFMSGLNGMWRLWRMGSSGRRLTSNQLVVMDDLFSKFPEMSWFSGFFPPEYPRYKDGVRQ